MASLLLRTSQECKSVHWEVSVLLEHKQLYNCLPEDVALVQALSNRSSSMRSSSELDPRARNMLLATSL